MSDTEMVKQAREFTERFGVENHAHWVPDGTSVVTIIAGLAALLTETRIKALSEKEAENARLRDALKDAAEELREIVSWTVTEKSKLRAQELDQIAVTQGKIRAALKAEGGEK